MNATDLGTQHLYRALLAHFRYTRSENFDMAIDHQLILNAERAQAQYGLTNAQYYQLADQAHAAAKAEAK